MNRRQFIQLASCSGGALVLKPLVSNATPVNSQQLLCVSSEFSLTSWPNISQYEVFTMQGDSVLKLMEFAEVISHREVIFSGITTWTDYVLAEGVFREYGVKISLHNRVTLKDPRGNNVQGFVWAA